MKYKWPTLEDRLGGKKVTRKEALRQLKECGMILSPNAEKELNMIDIITKEPALIGKVGGTPT